MKKNDGSICCCKKPPMSWEPIMSWTPNCHNKCGSNAGMRRGVEEEGSNLHDDWEHKSIALGDVSPVLPYQIYPLINTSSYQYILLPSKQAPLSGSGSHPWQWLCAACITGCAHSHEGWRQHSCPWHCVSSVLQLSSPARPSCRGLAFVLLWPECIHSLLVLKLRQEV